MQAVTPGPPTTLRNDGNFPPYYIKSPSAAVVPVAKNLPLAIGGPYADSVAGVRGSTTPFVGPGTSVKKAIIVQEFTKDFPQDIDMTGPSTGRSPSAFEPSQFSSAPVFQGYPTHKGSNPSHYAYPLYYSDAKVRDPHMDHTGGPKFSGPGDPAYLKTDPYSTSKTALTLIQMLVSIGGLTSAIMTVTLGCFHIFSSSAKLNWPKDFLSDVNDELWRQRLFSLSPNVLVDVWTPLLWGVVGVIVHIKMTHKGPISTVTANYLVYGIFLGLQALFANFGYRGGLGISIGIFSSGVAVAAVLVSVFGGDASASLNFDFTEYMRQKDDEACGV